MRTKYQLVVLALAVLLLLGTAVAMSPQQTQQLTITDGPRIENVSRNSAEIAWTTSSGGSSVIHYGTDPNNLSQTAQGPYSQSSRSGQHATHRVRIDNLQPNTTYYFFVEGPVGQFMTSGSGSSDRVRSGGSDRVPLYRAFSTAANRHLFTPSYQELRNAMSTNGYADEGVAGYVQRKQTPGTKPLYRLFVSAGNDHFYTADAQERQHVLGTGGARDEGIVGYIATTQQRGTVPLYRMQAQGQHFYTADPTERQRLLQQTWNDEGIVGYVWQQ